jgi:hypothetical protein
MITPIGDGDMGHAQRVLVRSDVALRQASFDIQVDGNLAKLLIVDN